MDFYALTPDEQAEKIKPLVGKAAGHWGITNPNIDLLKYRENAVYAITDPSTGTKYAMRVHRPGYHTDDALRSELQFMKALDDAGIHTPPIVPTKNGELFIVESHENVPEPRQIDLLGWIEGAPLGTIENEHDVNLDEVKQNHFVAGQIAARIHNFIDTWDLPAGFSRREWIKRDFVVIKATLGAFGNLIN